MVTLKHIGRLKNNQAKVLVAFRTLPGESDHALVIPVANLSDTYHNSIMLVVESDQAQTSFEFGELLHIRPFPDGRPMLLALREDGYLLKTKTDNVIMTPNTVDTILLSELNTIIAQQKNCAIDELCMFVSGAPKEKVEKETETLGRDVGEPNLPKPTAKVEPLKAAETEALTDQDIAKSYRSQADSLYKEAARLRKQADEIDPPKKKAKVAESEIG